MAGPRWLADVDVDIGIEIMGDCRYMFDAVEL